MEPTFINGAILGFVLGMAISGLLVLRSIK